MSSAGVKNSMLFVPPWHYPHKIVTPNEVLALLADLVEVRSRPSRVATGSPEIVSVSDIPSQRGSPVNAAMGIDDASSSSETDDESETNSTDDVAILPIRTLAEDSAMRSAVTPRDDVVERMTMSSDADSHTTTTATGSSAVNTPRTDARAESTSSLSGSPSSTTVIVAPATSKPNQLTISAASASSVVANEPPPAKIDPFASFTWQNARLVAHNNETQLGYLQGGASAYNESALHNAIWCGFGPIMRPKMWAVRLGFALCPQIDIHELVKTRGLEYIDYTELTKDVSRTYSTLDSLPPPFLSASRQPEAIYRLLCASACYNRAIGYAQSMNRLALVLVDVFLDRPWQQFWALDYILTRILPHYFMRNSTLGLLVDIALIAYYVRRRDRELSDALLKHDEPQMQIPNIVLHTLCAQWLSPMFVGSMRYGNVVRLWDAIIMGGAPALFTFVYRVLAYNRAAIIAASDITVIVTHLNIWLENLDSLDVLASVKMDKPIEATDVDARRASHLNAILSAQSKDRQFRRGVSVGQIADYVNVGRGCVCAHTAPLPDASNQPMSSVPPAIVADGGRVATGPFVASVTISTSTTVTTTTNTAVETRQRAASLPQWSLHRSVTEHSLFDDGSLNYSDASFTTDTIPLAAPLRGTSAAAMRHKRSGTRVASSNTTIGSAVPAVELRSNGTDG